MPSNLEEPELLDQAMDGLSDYYSMYANNELSAA